MNDLRQAISENQRVTAGKLDPRRRVQGEIIANIRDRVKEILRQLDETPS